VAAFDDSLGWLEENMEFVKTVSPPAGIQTDNILITT
jgi:hypothetical protein